MKQTAVDFIIEKLAENGVLHSSDIWMAKSIEKAHIIDAHLDGQLNVLNIIEEYLTPIGFISTSHKENKEDSIDYYNEIFNKKV